jgi:hypothetical protein
MIATFQNTAFVLSIGIFFTLIVTGLARTLPSAMYGGLTAQGVPEAAAAHISHLPPISVLFSAFLGYNPLKQLLGPHVLAHLPAGHAALLTSRSFFPHLVSTPFHDGLSVAFGFAIGANVLAAVASTLTGGRKLQAARAAAADRPPAASPGTGPAVARPDGDPAAEPAGAEQIPGAEVHGVVRNPVGSPVPGVTVSLADADGEIVATAVTGHDGTYRLAGVAGGEHTLVATGHPPATSTVHVEKGKTATVTVRLGDGPPGQDGLLGQDGQSGQGGQSGQDGQSGQGG